MYTICIRIGAGMQFAHHRYTYKDEDVIKKYISVHRYRMILVTFAVVWTCWNCVQIQKHYIYLHIYIYIYIFIIIILMIFCSCLHFTCSPYSIISSGFPRPEGRSAFMKLPERLLLGPYRVGHGEEYPWACYRFVWVCCDCYSGEPDRGQPKVLHRGIFQAQ